LWVAVPELNLVDFESAAVGSAAASPGTAQVAHSAGHLARSPRG
jgi:hypothetical protein